MIVVVLCVSVLLMMKFVCEWFNVCIVMVWCVYLFGWCLVFGGVCLNVWDASRGRGGGERRVILEFEMFLLVDIGVKK